MLRAYLECCRSPSPTKNYNYPFQPPSALFNSILLSLKNRTLLVSPTQLTSSETSNFAECERASGSRSTTSSSASIPARSHPPGDGSHSSGTCALTSSTTPNFTLHLPCENSHDGAPSCYILDSCARNP